MAGKTTDSKTKREVGERVNALFNIEPSTVKELGNGTFEAVITTSSVDRTSESIATGGISTDNYMANPVVLYGHDYDGLPIGKTLKLTTFKNKIKAQFQLAVEEYPFAATVAALIKGGYLNATSIGGIVKGWSDDYKTIEEMEMVEFSVVPVPANQEALITSRSLKDMTGKDIDTIKKEFSEFSKSILIDKIDKMPQDEVIDAIKILKNLVDRLEESATKSDALKDAKEPKAIVKRIVLGDAKAVQTQSQRVIKTIKLINQ